MPVIDPIPPEKASEDLRETYDSLSKRAGRVPLGLMRIDASSEQRFEVHIDARPTQTALDERVEAERRQMALVKNDWMAQRDRPAVIRLLVDQVEERLRPRAVAHIPVGEGLASGRRHGCRSQHNGGRIAQPIRAGEFCMSKPDVRLSKVHVSVSSLNVGTTEP